MAKALYFVGPWDLNPSFPCVPKAPDEGSIVLVESLAKGATLPYHRKKLVLVLSALHHFAEELREEGFDVHVVRAPTYLEGIAAQAKRLGAREIVAMQPREWGLHQQMIQAQKDKVFGVPLRLCEDGGSEDLPFLISRADFATWAKGKKQLRLDQFYAWMRKRSGWLMAGSEPLGGRFSFDSDNRQRVRDEIPPPRPHYPPDETTRAIMERVATWKGRWGEVEGFDWPVTREQALAELDDFLRARAVGFGPFQDAMVEGDPFLWHSRLSSSLNLGLLTPHEVCKRALDAFAAGRMPIASAEGFLRQIMGWREYVRGAYWQRMPQMRHANQLEAHRPLPRFYWEPEQSEMACMRDSVKQVHDHGYAHHIQRLMVLGNFALLAGIEPIELSHWFWAAFIDAYEWVELPNVHGMALWADAGFTTKPYAASGAYIDRMSDYCKGCPYDVKKRTGPQACPFNPLFWAFLEKHRAKVENNPRIRALYRTWDRWPESERHAIRASAAEVLARLSPSDYPWRFHDDQA